MIKTHPKRNKNTIDQDLYIGPSPKDTCSPIRQYKLDTH